MMMILMINMAGVHYILTLHSCHMPAKIGGHIIMRWNSNSPTRSGILQGFVVYVVAYIKQTYAALEHDIDSTMSFIKPNDDPIKHLASRQSTFSSNTQGLTNNTDDKDVAFATISPSGHDSRGVGLKHRKKRQLQVKFEDIQRLQKFFEDIINFKRHLERNERSLQLLKDLNNRYHKCIPRTPASEADHATFNDDINLHFADIETHRRNLNSLQRRAEGRSRLVSRPLASKLQVADARRCTMSLSFRHMKPSHATVKSRTDCKNSWKSNLIKHELSKRHLNTKLLSVENSASVLQRRQ